MTEVKIVLKSDTDVEIETHYFELDIIPSIGDTLSIEYNKYKVIDRELGIHFSGYGSWDDSIDTELPPRYTYQNISTNVTVYITKVQ